MVVYQNSLSFRGFQLDFLFQFVKQLGLNRKFDNANSLSPWGYSSFGYSNQLMHYCQDGVSRRYY